VTLSTSMAFFIGAGFAEWLSERLNVPMPALRVSVRRASFATAEQDSHGVAMTAYLFSC